MSLQLFTARNGAVEPGAVVEKFTLSSGTTITALTVGESGRGRKLGVIPVVGAEPGETIKFVVVGKTRRGGIRFEVAEKVTSSSEAVVIFRTTPGFRGSCDHEGEIQSWHCDSCGEKYSAEEAPDDAKDRHAPECKGWFYGSGVWVCDPLPGKILAEGYTAQGDAGRMGGGPQLVLLFPAGEVVRQVRSGRLYGKHSVHYFHFNGERLDVATWDERVATDCF